MTAGPARILARGARMRAGLCRRRRPAAVALAMLLAGVTAPAGAADGLTQFEALIRPKLPADAITYAAAEPAGPSGFVLRDVVVVTPPTPLRPEPRRVSIGAVVVDDIDFESLARDAPPAYGHVRLEAVDLTKDAPPGMDPKAFGLDRAKAGPMLADARLDYRADPRAAVLTLERLEVTLRGLARMELSFVLDGITPDDLMDPEKSLAKTSLRTASVVYEDASLLAQMLPLVAEIQGTKPQAFVGMLLAGLDEQRKGEPPATRAALASVAAFLRDWRRPKGPLRLSITPPPHATAAKLSTLEPSELGLKVTYAGAAPVEKPQGGRKKPTR